MQNRKLILGIISIIIIVFLLFTAISPILFIAEDTTEGDPGIDMAAKFSIIGGFNWIYPGDSVNAEGQTLHNIHLNDPQDPYGAARDIISYTYHFTPHIIVSVNDIAAADIFGSDILDSIREYDWGQGMDRGDASSQAMADSGINIFAIPLHLLTGNIKIFIV